MEEGKLWRIRDGGEKDREKIIALRKIVFGEMERDKCDPAFWTWEFLEGPDGKAWIYLLEDEGRIVGHLADIPRQFSVHGKRTPGTLSVDLMVHPDYRRRGFFLEMARYAIKRVKEENRLFMSIYPIRRETIHGFKKLEWKVVLELPVLVYPIRFEGIFQRYLRFRLPCLVLGGIARSLYSIFFKARERPDTGGLEIEEVFQLDDQFDRFWEKALSLHPILGVRDQPFLRWRYIHHPTRRYAIYRALKEKEMVGYIVLREVDLLQFNSAVIVDLLALNGQALAALVRKGIEHSRVQGIDLLGFMVPKNHDYYRTLRGMGFLPSPKTFRLMIYPQGQEETLLPAENWYVNWGDTDVI